jgi:hypothetical protein
MWTTLVRKSSLEATRLCELRRRLNTTLRGDNHECTLDLHCRSLDDGQRRTSIDPLTLRTRQPLPGKPSRK